jgi:hypothetical protein
MHANLPTSSTRRLFLQRSLVAGSVLGFAELTPLSRLRPVSAEEVELSGDVVRFSDDIEPLVRLLEETPRDQIVEVFAARIQAGTSYQQVLTALLLAGVRNVQPRPSVGFKFHAVLVVNSAHLASLDSPPEDRWLPIFWALDYFKSAQASDENEGNWTMQRVDEAKVPPPHLALAAFREAMDQWDVEAADVAVAALARSASANELFDVFARYGCRDFRSIGHKAIYVANAFRTLQCIGWRFAEPVLRSLAYALLNHTGEPNPATANLFADVAWARTQAQLPKFNRQWLSGQTDAARTQELLASLRSDSPEQAVDRVATMVQQGVHPQSVSDALYLSAAEMLGQQPGIVALHAATSTNALQYAFLHAKSPKVRQAVLLQNAAFIPYFRQAMQARGQVATATIDAHLAVIPQDQSSGRLSSEQLQVIFDAISSNRTTAAEEMFQYLSSGGPAESVIQSARRLVFLKGNDSHDYKFSSAVLEDYYNLSPQFRPTYLAAAAYLLPGNGDRDNGLVNRIKQALA